MIVIGTSGSTDYLKEKEPGRRYWPVRPDPAADELAKIGHRLWADLRAALRADLIVAACDGTHETEQQRCHS
jgi:hypothetical protein